MFYTTHACALFPLNTVVSHCVSTSLSHWNDLHQTSIFGLSDLAAHIHTQFLLKKQRRTTCDNTFFPFFQYNNPSFFKLPLISL